MESEHQIQTSIINYLRGHGWYAMRLNSGAVRTTNRYGKQHMMRLAAGGTPDIMAFKKGYYAEESGDCSLLFIEVKKPGNRTTLLQDLKMQELTEYGAKCIVAYKREDLDPYLA